MGVIPSFLSLFKQFLFIQPTSLSDKSPCSHFGDPETLSRLYWRRQCGIRLLSPLKPPL